MFKVFACVTALLFTGTAYSQTHYVNGHWWDGDKFNQQDWYEVDGKLTRRAPEKLDNRIDLRGGFVIPPFAEGHNHNLQSPWLAENYSKHYINSGILYGLMMCGSATPATAQKTRTVLRQQPVNIDLVSACITSSDGHPVRMALQPDPSTGKTRPLDDIYDKSLIIMDEVEDIRAKLPLITASGTRTVKIILVHHEDAGRRNNEEYFGVNGLNEEVVHALVPTLKQAGLRVAAHVESAADFALAVSAGVDIIAHLPGYHFWEGYEPSAYRLTDESIQQAARKGIHVITTASTARLIYGEPKNIPAGVIENQRKNLTKLRSNGVSIILGSDNFAGNILTEYDYIKGLNVFGDKQLLNLLTRDTAQALFPDLKIGELREGYDASFLVLKRNPLLDAEALRQPSRVVYQGAVLVTNEGD